MLAEHSLKYFDAAKIKKRGSNLFCSKLPKIKKLVLVRDCLLIRLVHYHFAAHCILKSLILKTHMCKQSKWSYHNFLMLWIENILPTLLEPPIHRTKSHCKKSWNQNRTSKWPHEVKLWQIRSTASFVRRSSSNFDQIWQNRISKNARQIFFSPVASIFKPFPKTWRVCKLTINCWCTYNCGRVISIHIEKKSP